jgi:hypothetical protein
LHPMTSFEQVVVPADGAFASTDAIITDANTGSHQYHYALHHVVAFRTNTGQEPIARYAGNE